MLVYLIRHSLAADIGMQPDAHRHLTQKGRSRALAVGKRLAAEGARFDRILMSPLVRAVQTAELLAQRVPSGELLVLDALLPGTPAQAVLSRIGSAGSIALVGHAPGISDIGALLVSRPGFPPFRPCQVAVIESGRPRYVLNPETVELEPLIVDDA
jgi:phosphohistidine phosphatase